MYSPDRPSPAPPLSRASLVIGLCAAMALVGLLVAAGRGDPNVFVSGEAPPPWLLGAGPLLGVAVGLLVVWLSRIATKRWQWARDLHGSFKDLLGPLTSRDIVILALASSVGEEVLFRGALLPWLGIWVQAAVFAALHIGPGKRFVPWTAMALVMGLGFGQLAITTGTLAAPIAAHFVINFLNLRHIVRTEVARRTAEKLLSSSAAA
jgi:membrane protease YdiL (CAAX protease family)